MEWIFDKRPEHPQMCYGTPSPELNTQHPFCRSRTPTPSGPQQTIMDLPSLDNCIYTIKMESVGRRWRKQKVLAGVCIWKPNKPI